MSIIGTQIRDLKILSAIGEGGMGIVYLAEHIRLGRKFAIKCLNPGLANSAVLQDRFREEGISQARLSHPNIVQVTDFFEENGRFYLLMEYVSGTSLDEIIESEGMLPAKICVPFLKDILNGLNFAHSQGVIHRDIKPSNIIIDHLDRARIMDFGIAIRAGEKRLTKTGTDVGTAWYMSPEQVTGPKEIDHRSDVYSIGVVFYEMLAGRVPFDGNTDYVIKDKHVREIPADVRLINSDIPIELAGIVMKAIEKDPDDRFSGCGEFLEYIVAYELQNLSESRPGFDGFQQGDGMAESKMGSERQEEERGITANLSEPDEPASQPDGDTNNRISESTFTDSVTGMEFLYVPGGQFRMGDIFGDGNSDEKPVREMEIAGFYMGKFPVTQGQWKSVMENNPSRFSKGDNFPVEMVSWDDAQEFIRKITSANSRKYHFRLPTEAEWEFAARSGGKEEKFAGGNTIESVAWHTKNSGNSTHPVGEKTPNGSGFHDMNGNVYEWCQDWFSEYLSEESVLDIDMPAATERTLRGGGWDSDSAKCRTTSRYGNWPKYRDDSWGFRLAVDMEPPEALSGNLNIVSIPEGASIWLDGHETGEQTDTVMDVPTGNHEVNVKLDGYEHAGQEARVTQYDISEMEFRLFKKPVEVNDTNIEKRSNHTAAKKTGKGKLWVMTIVLICAAVFYLGFVLLYQDENRKEQPEIPRQPAVENEKQLEKENQDRKQVQRETVREQDPAVPPVSSSDAMKPKTVQGCVSGNCNNGQGTYVFRDDSIYEGEFKGNNPHGEGTITYADGKKYTGQFHNGKKEGIGTLTLPDGSEYTGAFKEDNPNGKGTFVSPNGGKYVGEYRNGKREGKGILTYPNGSKYAGAFKDGKPHGKGTFTSPNRGRYKGEYKNGKRDGKGTLTYTDGSKYTGYFRSGKCHGQGTLNTADGGIFKGQWKNGRPHGPGTFVSSGGRTFFGKYEKVIVLQKASPRKRYLAEKTVVTQADQVKKNLGGPDKAAQTHDYICYHNGIVRDKNTGLEWYAGPDRDTTFHGAEAWVESLDSFEGGGWRLPSFKELTPLYKLGSGRFNVTPFLKTSGWKMWAAPEKAREKEEGGHYFNFSYGVAGWGDSHHAGNARVLAVRTPKN